MVEEIVKDFAMRLSKLNPIDKLRAGKKAAEMYSCMCFECKSKALRKQSGTFTRCSACQSMLEAKARELNKILGEG